MSKRLKTHYVHLLYTYFDPIVTSNTFTNAKILLSADIEFPPPPLDLPPITNEVNGDKLQTVNSPILTASSDLATTEPSVEEASSRFGVSLRKRDPSTDSCNSLGSPATGVLNEICNGSGKSVISRNKLKLDTKLIAEMKEKSEKYKKKHGDVPNSNDFHCSNRNNNSAKETNDQLVNEFAENVNMPKSDLTGKNLKAHLKKVNPCKKSEGSNPAPFNFKSRLRKVENKTESTQISNNEQASEERDTSPKNYISKISCDLIVVTNDRDTELTDITSEEEDKRKSTGSIGSLKKLWEAKEGNGTNSISDVSQIQSSPKLSSNSSTFINHNKNNEDKPVVPTKPTKFVSIYATPIPITLSSDPQSPISSTTAQLITSESSIFTVSREAIFELILLLENTLKIPTNLISASQWLQLSDKLHILHSSCVSFANTASMAPHLKFQFRDLLSRIENQSRNLRSAGSKNSQDNEKLVYEVGQSLKQISNTLNR